MVSSDWRLVWYWIRAMIQVKGRGKNILNNISGLRVREYRAGLLMLQHKGLTNLYQTSRQQITNKRSLTVKTKLWLPEILFSGTSKAIKCLEIRDFGYPPSRDVQPQAAQALFMSHTRNTIWRRIIRVCMGFSKRYPWRSLKVKIFNKNGLPYSIHVLFTPGVVILPI